jgi:hypothetical protein
MNHPAWPDTVWASNVAWLYNRGGRDRSKRLCKLGGGQVLTAYILLKVRPRLCGLWLT